MLNTKNNTTILHSFNKNNYNNNYNLMTPLQQHLENIPWSNVKNYLSECWLQFYGPFFWIIHLFLCNLELHKKQHPSIDLHCNTISQSIVFEKENSHPFNINAATEDHNNKNSNDTINSNNSQTDIDDDNASSTSSSSSTTTTNITSRSPKSSFKHSLKGHLKSIKQKAMKRSILRKNSKQSLNSFQEEASPTSPCSPSSPTSLLPNNASSISLPSNSLYRNHNSSDNLQETDEEDNITSLTKQPVLLSLDRRPSLSDSLLKSFSKKKKQPSLPFPMTLQSNHNYSKTTASLLSSSTIHFGRRETSPTIY
ncbi:hypothetical protein BJ944DRAFT_11179 [Cunninghamella echinulata]|nr:hypothetical protein BJ944DRAFT_11179 [Cunninghamella echinulata]